MAVFVVAVDTGLFEPVANAIVGAAGAAGAAEVAAAESAAGTVAGVAAVAASWCAVGMRASAVVTHLSNVLDIEQQTVVDAGRGASAVAEPVPASKNWGCPLAGVVGAAVQGQPLVSVVPAYALPSACAANADHRSHAGVDPRQPSLHQSRHVSHTPHCSGQQPCL